MKDVFAVGATIKSLSLLINNQLTPIISKQLKVRKYFENEIALIQNEGSLSRGKVYEDDLNNDAFGLHIGGKLQLLDGLRGNSVLLLIFIFYYYIY